MSVATVITNSTEAEGMIRWSLLFALASEGTALQILHTDQVPEKEIKEHLALWVEEGHATVEDISITVLGKKFDEDLIVDTVDAALTELLVIGQNRTEDSNSNDQLRALRKLFDKAMCDSVIIRLGNRKLVESDQVLVPTAGGPHSQIALKLSSALAKRFEGEIVPLYIESDIGEKDGQAVGIRVLKRFVERAGLDTSDKEHIKPQIVVSNDVGKGIARAAREKPYDLILMGASNSMIVKKKLFGVLPESVFEGDDAMTVALIRKRRPVGHRIRQRFERFLALRIPQLEREERVALFDRLQTQSVWSFDFVMLILLSTGIASLGLIQSSPAVVIGAMLVAPLMTPLLGSGMSLVQGNLPLMLSCIKAIILGFLAALIFGTLIGAVAPVTTLTSELAARGAPNLLDFGVAFLSGIAASYCVARPALSSALAGVAIAAALVPPIATVGISLALREWGTASGAALLFGTNVVAIILASAITFFAIGIRGQIGAKTLWARRTLLLLFAALGMLLIPLSAVLVSKAGKVANEKSDVSVTRAKIEGVISGVLKTRPQNFGTVTVSKFARNGKEVDITCRIESPEPVSAALAASIRDKLKTEFKKEKVSVRILTDLVVGGE